MTRIALPSLNRPRARRTAATLTAFAMLAALPACSSSDNASAASNTSSEASSTASTGAVVELKDPYVKAEKASGDMAMSAIFGILSNTSQDELTVVKATADVADSVELHETSMLDGRMKMRPKQGGFAIPAGGSVELKPGGDHLMLIGLKQDIRPGDTVGARLELSDGSTITAQATARDMSNAQESYRPEDSMPSKN